MATDSSIPALTTVDLKVDPELRDLIPPLTDDEYTSLKESIRNDGCREPLTIWKGQNIILDGHNRYEICRDLKVPFNTVEIVLPDLTAAKIWMIRNQKGRRNLAESQWAMLAVKLEALYAEEAKGRKGSRRDLGQNLGQGDFGRSAEKAAKDMGVSHQTVSYAKQVSNKGIPDLVKLVESGYASVSSAAKATSLPAKIQMKVVEKAQTHIKEGTRPNIPAIIREIAPKATRDSPDDLLERSRNGLYACQEQLETVETTQRPENLVEMKAMSERLTARLKEIEENSLDPELKSKENCVIELRQFKTFIESIAAVSKTANLRFDSDGVRAKASSPHMAVDAFLPKELFSRYAVLGEMGLPDTDKLLGMFSTLSNRGIPGKINLRIYVEPGVDGNPNQLHMISGLNEMIYVLQNPFAMEELKFSEPISNCKVRIDGENLAKAIKQSSVLGDTAFSKSISKMARFLVSEKSFRIISEDENQDKGTAKPKCEVLGDGSADSTFAIDQLIAINPTIAKSNEATLRLGINESMILELDIDGMTTEYQIAGMKPKKALARLKSASN